MAELPAILGIHPVLGVKDVEQAANWYAKVLDGDVTLRWPEAPDAPLYAAVTCGVLGIHLTNADPELQRAPGRVYVFVEELDSWAHALRSRGLTLEFGPERSVLGVLELAVRDPDGNQLCFGQRPDARPAPG